METQTKSPRELIEEADRLLRSNGFNIFGKDKKENNYHHNYLQIVFERRMQTGAYSRNSERRKK